MAASAMASIGVDRGLDQADPRPMRRYAAHIPADHHDLARQAGGHTGGVDEGRRQPERPDVVEVQGCAPLAVFGAYPDRICPILAHLRRQLDDQRIGHVAGADDGRQSEVRAGGAGNCVGRDSRNTTGGGAVDERVAGRQTIARNHQKIIRSSADRALIRRLSIQFGRSGDRPDGQPQRDEEYEPSGELIGGRGACALPGRKKDRDGVLRLLQIYFAMCSHAAFADTAALESVPAIEQEPAVR